MSYVIFVLETNFRISKENTDAVLKAAKSLCLHQPTLPLSGGKRTAKFITRLFSFVDSDAIQNYSTVFDVLDGWRWMPSIDDEGNIESLEFLGEKLGDEEILFKAIAPFVEAGSTIIAAGEDGKVWRWRFDGEKCHYELGKVVF
jgi:hypothetical protein